MIFSQVSIYLLTLSYRLLARRGRVRIPKVLKVSKIPMSAKIPIIPKILRFQNLGHIYLYSNFVKGETFTTIGDLLSNKIKSNVVER